MRLSRESSKSLARWIRANHPQAVAEAGAEALDLEVLGFVAHGDECIEWGGGTFSSNGYGMMWTGVNTRRVHRLFKEAMDGVTDLNALHRCGNKLCVRPGHIYFGTQKQNVEDQFRLGENTQHGESHNRARLTYAIVAEMRQRWGEGESMGSLAREFNVSHGAVSKAVRGITWARN